MFIYKKTCIEKSLIQVNKGDLPRSRELYWQNVEADEKTSPKEVVLKKYLG